jgi:YVTN family beta-propeller protein
MTVKPGSAQDDARQAAGQDYDGVVTLIGELVRISSRGGTDSYDPVLGTMAAWLSERGLPCRRLADPGGTTVALICEVAGAGPGPRYVLDACLDTAPFGDEGAWTYPPLSGRILDGWLHGRGSCDSKAGAAIFAHIAARLRQAADSFVGTVVLLFDVDEHTGSFGGAKAYFDGLAVRSRVDGVMIGYPGLEHVIIGGRGVLRAQVQTRPGRCEAHGLVEGTRKMPRLIFPLHRHRRTAPGRHDLPVPLPPLRRYHRQGLKTPARCPYLAVNRAQAKMQGQAHAWPCTARSLSFAIVITPDGKTAYVTNTGSDTVTPIRTATNTALKPVKVGDLPYGIAITPDGKTAYVANDMGTVTPIRTATNTALKAIKLEAGVLEIAITP